MIPGVILAAGASTRMGRPKPFLPVGATGETFLARIAATLVQGGVDDVVVVVAPEAPDPPADVGAVRVVRTRHPERGQIASLHAALDVVDRPGVRGVLVTLVDLPLIRPSSVRAVLDGYARSAAPIVRPRCAGRHGHPVLFDRRVFDALRRAPLETGAKAVLRAFETEILNVEVDDEGVFRDIDTPEDYRAAIGPLPDG